MKRLLLLLGLLWSLAGRGQAIYVNQLNALAKQPPTPQRDSVVAHYLFALSKNITPQQDQWVDSLRQFSAQQNNHFGLLLWQIIDSEKVIRTLNFKEGIRKHLAFARQLETDNRPRYASWSYLRAGMIFARPSSEFIQKQDALLYYNKALELSIKANDTTEIIRAYDYIGEYYLDRQAYKKAIVYLKKAERLLTRNSDKYLYPTILASLGSCYLLVNDETMAQNYYRQMNDWLTNGQLSLKPFYSAYILNIYYLGFATYHQKQAQHSKAIAYALKGYEAVQGFKKMGNTRTYDTYVLDHLKILYEASAKTNDFASAFQYLQEYQAIQNNHLQSDLDKRFQELNKKYQTDQKQIRIVRLENDKARAEVETQKTLRYFLMALSVLLAIGIGFIYWSNQKIRAKNRAITAAHLQGQTIERQRVAADLHDNLGTTLSALHWNLEAMDNSKLSPTEQAVYATIRQQVDQAYQDVRLLSHNLLPNELAKQGLAIALQNLVEKMNRNTAVHFRLSGANILPRLDQQTEFELYSICLELLNNTLKHANATESHIDLAQVNNTLHLTVGDNGAGLNGHQSDGRGLQNIAARVASLGGTWDVDSGPGGGVLNRISVPVKAAIQKA